MVYPLNYVIWYVACLDTLVCFFMTLRYTTYTCTKVLALYCIIISFSMQNKYMRYFLFKGAYAVRGERSYNTNRLFIPDKISSSLHEGSAGKSDTCGVIQLPSIWRKEPT